MPGCQMNFSWGDIFRANAISFSCSKVINVLQRGFSMYKNVFSLVTKIQNKYLQHFIRFLSLEIMIEILGIFS